MEITFQCREVTVKLIRIYENTKKQWIAIYEYANR